MIFIINILFAILLIKGMLLIYDSAKNIPPARTTKHLQSQAVKKRDVIRVIEETLVEPLSTMLLPLVRISKEKELKLLRDLPRAGILKKPKEYYAHALAIAVYSLFIPVLTILAGMKTVSIISLLIPVVAFLHFTTTYQDELEKKKKQIEFVLPSFIRAIIYKINDNGGQAAIKADMITIFEDYLRIAPDVFVYDIQKLVTEMKAKDIETALNNFNKRLAIPEVSLLTDALVGLTRGERQTEVLDSLAREMDVKIKNSIRAELEKRPGKVLLASIPLFVMAIVAIFYVFINATISGLGSLL